MNQLLLDFLPVLVFFVVYKIYNIFIATGALIVATLLQTLFLYKKNGKLETMQWMILGTVVILGGATLALHDATIIKYKPTVLYWCFGLALLVCRWGFGRNIIAKILEPKLPLSDDVFDALNLMFVIFFALMGSLNLYIAKYFSTDVWINFKLFGTLGCTIAFFIVISVYLSKHVKQIPSNAQKKRID